MPVLGDEISFRPHTTAGGGDCAIHALCGEVSQGRFYCVTPRERLLRSFDGTFDDIASRLEAADPEIKFWHPLLTDIWKELFVETLGGSVAVEGRLFVRDTPHTQPTNP